MNVRAYLDNAATTAPLPAAIEAARRVMEQSWGNPSSLHEVGKQARAELNAARASVARALSCAPDCVTFTSGGTESINTALRGAAWQNRRIGRHIVSTAIEHEATLETLAALRDEGFEITLVPPARDGVVPLQSLTAAMRDDTILLSIMAVNNETGAVQPYAEAAQALKARNARALVHVDAVQAFLKLPLTLEGIDLVSVSAHKLGGLKGCGALYVRQGIKLRPYLTGGGQESSLRSGTEAMPAIAAFGAACAARRAAFDENTASLAQLRANLLGRLSRLGLPCVIHSPQDGAPHIINLSLCRGRSEVYVRALSDRGVCVSGGSACARGKRSYVLSAMKLDSRSIDAALRVSLCPETTEDDLAAFCAALRDAADLF